MHDHLDDPYGTRDQGGSAWPVILIVGGVLGCLGLGSLMLCSVASVFYLGASAPQPVVWEYDHGYDWTEPVPSLITDPRVADLQNAQGAWIRDFSVDFYGAEPPVFRHHFLVFQGSYSYVSPGAIVVGERWDNSESPLWRVVYGHTRDDGQWYIGGHGLTYLGETWDPAWIERADILYEEIGQKDLPTMIEHP